MRVVVEETAETLSREAALCAAEGIRMALAERNEARVVLGVDAGLIDVSEKLAAVSGIDWARVILFSFSEYVRLSEPHLARICNRLRQHFIEKLPMPLRAFNVIDGEARDLGRECLRLKRLVDIAPVDVACVGLGESGALAFNDPPADLETEDAYSVLRLSAECRSRQAGEGWFGSAEEVPKHAICMSVPQFMRCRRVVCTAPDARRAAAVKNVLRGPISNLCPASVLQVHKDCTVFLDPDSASGFWRQIGYPVFSAVL